MTKFGALHPLMATRGVVGIGQKADGSLTVYVEEDHDPIPDNYHGSPVTVIVSGRFKAL